MLKRIAGRGVGLASLLFVAFLIVAYLSPASAAMMSCRADPILYLSDGSLLTVTVDIGTDVVNVTNIVYTFHVPKGVKLLNVVHTPFPGFVGKEKIDFHDDNQPGKYLSDTVVQTRYNKTSVVATSILNDGVQTLAGVNAQHLKILHIR